VRPASSIFVEAAVLNAELSIFCSVLWLNIVAGLF